ncbi:HET-domain-containing protein [Zopfia rhizophila CBS 207.26]|uniref:HET-domain-containing protein n=1 Tax=Zopfia rhizophila CBS 207.26 TaxID=1314779 RepID=A0A6A6E3H9_9PEZI|nr:HET-domain-containing protein [Zopfia rhizophila CBS 207.26]
MRLLHTAKVNVESFPSPETPYIPDYAILSHRWGDEEVSLQMIQETPEPEGLRDREGYKKILKCCEQAASVGFEYIWVDTCCIDKTNNVELTEALNSMFHWYRESQVCYAYLSDVPSNEDPRAENSQFCKSKWFTRGWTLQELLSPLYVIFFGQDWKEIGTKATQRMAWASKRETAKIEDQAYCLMGLFGVNMPMIYGEGENAFQRLQLEIMKTSDDQSIFAWSGRSDKEGRGLLAISPREFQFYIRILHDK